MQGSKPQGIVREAQRYQLTGVPTSTWYDLQNAGLAPKPIHLGLRSVGWLISQLEEWIGAPAERDKTWQQVGDVAAKVTQKVKPVD